MSVMSDQFDYTDASGYTSQDFSDEDDTSQNPGQNPSQDFSDEDDDSVPEGYELAQTGYPDHGACYQVAGGVVDDRNNPGAKAICKYNRATGKYDLYVYAPADDPFRFS